MYKINYLLAIFIVLLLLNFLWKAKKSWKLTSKYNRLDYVYFSIRLLVFLLLVYPENGIFGATVAILGKKYAESHFVMILFALGVIVLAIQNIHSWRKEFVPQSQKNVIRKNWLIILVMVIYMVLFRFFKGFIKDYFVILIFTYWILLYYIDEKFK